LLAGGVLSSACWRLGGFASGVLLVLLAWRVLAQLSWRLASVALSAWLASWVPK